MSKIFNIRFRDNLATVSINIPTENGWIKKTLSASSGDELWAGLEALDRLDELTAEAKAGALEYISKQSERELLSTAIPEWLQKGNRIKLLPPAFGGVKKALTPEEQEEVLAMLADLEEAV